jgi:hypothetical protein
VACDIRWPGVHPILRVCVHVQQLDALPTAWLHSMDCRCLPGHLYIWLIYAAAEQTRFGEAQPLHAASLVDVNPSCTDVCIESCFLYYLAGVRAGVVQVQRAQLNS